MGIESTIVGFDEGITVYRLGGLAVEDIERVVGKVKIQINQSSNPTAPGMLKSHYAPRKPLFIGDVEDFIKNNFDKKIGILSFYQDYNKRHSELVSESQPTPNPSVGGELTCKILSHNQDLKEAAHNLFALCAN